MLCIFKSIYNVTIFKGLPHYTAKYVIQKIKTGDYIRKVAPCVCVVWR